MDEFAKIKGMKVRPEIYFWDILLQISCVSMDEFRQVSHRKK